MKRRQFLSGLVSAGALHSAVGSRLSGFALQADAAAVTRVLVMFKCHLDVGFVDTQAAIMRLYFDHYFPKAIDIGEHSLIQTFKPRNALFLGRARKRRKCTARGGDRILRVLRVGKTYSADDVARRRVVEVEPLLSVWRHKLAVDIDTLDAVHECSNQIVMILSIINCICIDKPDKLA